MQTCPKCGYVRKPTDTAPEWECPSCRIAYAKFGTLPHGHTQNIDSSISFAAAEHSGAYAESSLQHATAGETLAGQSDVPGVRAARSKASTPKISWLLLMLLVGSALRYEFVPPYRLETAFKSDNATTTSGIVEHQRRFAPGIATVTAPIRPLRFATVWTLRDRRFTTATNASARNLLIIALEIQSLFANPASTTTTTTK